MGPGRIVGVAMVIVICILAPEIQAGRILIVTDEPKAKTAVDARDDILGIPPFYEMKTLKVDIVQLSSAELAACGPKPPFMMMMCGNGSDAFHAALAKKHNADRVIVIKKGVSPIASGGGVGVTMSTYSSRLAIHELLHTFGFADDYEFQSEAMANNFCREVSAPNLVITKSPPQPGWYPSDVCKKATNGFKGWRLSPSSVKNAMSDPASTYIPKEWYPLIYKGLRESLPQPQREVLESPDRRAATQP